MSFWTGFRSWFGGGALTNPDEGAQETRPSGNRSASNIVVTDERAMMVSAVFACVRLLVQTGATLPMNLYRQTGDGREPLDIDHPLCQLLKYKPNQYMTGKEFRQAMWAQRVLWGNAYAKIRRSAGRPVSITPLKPEFMTVERGESGLLYHYNTKNGTDTYTQNDIFHLKGWSSDGIVGLSALGYARESLGLSVSADQSASKAVNGRANAVLEVDDYPTEEQRKQLRDLYGGKKPSSVYEADGQLMITVGGMKYRGISMNPDDLQLLESRQFQIPEICRFFGVPAVMVDGSAGATAAWPASYEQQVLAFLTFGLKPYLEEWEDKTIATLGNSTDRSTIIVEHNVEGLLRTDSAGRAEYYSKMVQNGLMTRNEIRRKENLKPYPDGDDLTVQINLTNLEDLPKAGGQNDDAG